MKITTILCHGFLMISLTACGVREEEDLEGVGLPSQVSATNSSAGDVSSTPTVPSQVSGVASGAGLTFIDEYTGFWVQPGFPLDVIRLAFLDGVYHVDRFQDFSVRQGTSGLNCFQIGGASTQVIKFEEGLRAENHVNPTTSYTEWTADGTNLFESFYAADGSVPNGFGTTEYVRTLPGLSPNDLQICTS